MDHDGEVVERARAMLAEVLETEVELSSTLAGLEADSLSVMEWVFLMEERFDVEIPETRLRLIDGDTSVDRLIADLLPTQ